MGLVIKLNLNPELYDKVKLSELGYEGFEMNKSKLSSKIDEKLLYEKLTPAMLWKKELKLFWMNTLFQKMKLRNYI